MDLGFLVRLAVAVAVFVMIMRVGVAVMRALAHGEPEPPPPGELRKVSIRYRCSICGTELKLMLAPDQDPEAPRHCQEEMDLVAPID